MALMTVDSEPGSPSSPDGGGQEDGRGLATAAGRKLEELSREFGEAHRIASLVEDHGAVHEAVEDGGRHHGITEDLAPLGQTPVGGDERRMSLAHSGC